MQRAFYGVGFHCPNVLRIRFSYRHLERELGQYCSYSTTHRNNTPNITTREVAHKNNIIDNHVTLTENVRDHNVPEDHKVKSHVGRSSLAVSFQLVDSLCDAGIGCP
jgi:hypothetical protein